MNSQELTIKQPAIKQPAIELPADTLLCATGINKSFKVK